MKSTGGRLPRTPEQNGSQNQTNTCSASANEVGCGPSQFCTAREQILQRLSVETDAAHTFRDGEIQTARQSSSGASQARKHGVEGAPPTTGGHNRERSFKGEAALLQCSVPATVLSNAQDSASKPGMDGFCADVSMASPTPLAPGSTGQFHAAREALFRKQFEASSLHLGERTLVEHREFTSTVSDARKSLNSRPVKYLHRVGSHKVDTVPRPARCLSLGMSDTEGAGHGVPSASGDGSDWSKCQRSLGPSETPAFVPAVDTKVAVQDREPALGVPIPRLTRGPIRSKGQNALESSVYREGETVLRVTGAQEGATGELFPPTPFSSSSCHESLHSPVRTPSPVLGRQGQEVARGRGCSERVVGEGTGVASHERFSTAGEPDTAQEVDKGMRLNSCGHTPPCLDPLTHSAHDQHHSTEQGPKGLAVTDGAHSEQCQCLLMEALRLLHSFPPGYEHKVGEVRSLLQQAEKEAAALGRTVCELQERQQLTVMELVELGRESEALGMRLLWMQEQQQELEEGEKEREVVVHAQGNGGEKELAEEELLGLGSGGASHSSLQVTEQGFEGIKAEEEQTKEGGRGEMREELELMGPSSVDHSGFGQGPGGPGAREVPCGLVCAPQLPARRSTANLERGMTQPGWLMKQGSTKEQHWGRELVRFSSMSFASLIESSGSTPML